MRRAWNLLNSGIAGLAAAAIAAGCLDQPAGPTPDFPRVEPATAATTTCFLYYLNDGVAPTEASCANGTRIGAVASSELYHSADPQVYQMAPITIAFDRPIYAVRVTWTGNANCSGFLGSVNGVPFHKVTENCDIGPRGGVQAGEALLPDLGTTTLVLQPPDPPEWFVAAEPPFYEADTAYVRAEYGIVFVLEPPCSGSDTLLADQSLRQRFDSAFWAGFGDPPLPESQRKEHLVAGYRYPDGHIVSEDMNVTSANNCTVRGYIPPFARDSAVLVLIMHSHPYDPGLPGGASEMMTVCDTVQARVAKAYPPRPTNWSDGANNDWQYMDGVNSSRVALGLPLVTGYVLDRRFLYRMEPNQLPAHPDSVVGFDITSNACRWP